MSWLDAIRLKNQYTGGQDQTIDNWTTSPGQYTAIAGNDWTKMRDKMLASQLADKVNVSYSPSAGAASPNMTGFSQPQTGGGTPGSIATQPVSTLSTQQPGTISPGDALRLASLPQANPSSPSGAPAETNNPSDAQNWTISPGRYYSDYPQATIGKLAGDPATAAREWANFTNTGGNAFARYMSGVFSDPMAILRTQGVDPGKLDQMGPSRLDQFQMLWDRMSGNRSSSGGNNMYMNPQQMLGNILNATYSPNGEATSLGGMLANPNLLPEEQVQNTVGLILSSLQGIMSDESLNAYSATLNEFAQDWLANINKNPDQFGKTPFVTALRQRFGSGGGLM